MPECTFRTQKCTGQIAPTGLKRPQGAVRRLLATAPDPSYPGAHSAISGAAAAILASVYGDNDKISVTSDVLPGVTRSFNSYSAAASEAGLSRIYGGVHTRIDHEAGIKLGHDVAGFVIDQAGSSTFGLSPAQRR